VARAVLQLLPGSGSSVQRLAVLLAPAARGSPALLRRQAFRRSDGLRGRGSVGLCSRTRR